ncbi:hypothetical protein L207DRAFT_585020 [Hyaloscypha variabilis F]|uniref:Uncharacterized protein n=1 Tax=Hyaloscypha variabilis (strain UAMH 11265 / GT02V1 / F) TaxID=1149755 RepID=A0A2J6RHY0_HYAVF|nr:hypothetical protein L207DRAFT_585020 [Hyaloscypha variabilis F]
MAVPVILAEDLATFHAAHFSADSTTHFAERFLGPVEDETSENIEDDGLGYYEDGIKRTLTDEQIAIFRHSEIQALLRGRRHAAEARQDRQNRQEQEELPEEHRRDGPLRNVAVEVQGQGEQILEDGELDDEAVTLNADLRCSPPVTKDNNLKKKGKKPQKAKQKSFFKQHIKPDLRKRTWDKVDTGLESLDYDEGDSSTAATRPAQRKRVSYEDN